MAAASRCAEVETRLTQALLARTEPDAETRAHAEACRTCAAVLRELMSLRHSLDGIGVASDVPEPVASATLARARSLLAGSGGAARALVPIPGGLPEGFTGECLRLLGVALLPFPLVVAWNLALLALGEQLLQAFVPAALLSALGVAYLAAAAGWSALLYGSIPILAHHRAQRRTAEVTP